MNCIENIGWKSVVSIKAIFYENGIRLFYVNLSFKEKRDDIYLSSYVYGVKIELNSNILAQIFYIPRGDFTRTYVSYQFIKTPNTPTPLDQMRLMFDRTFDDGEMTIVMPLSCLKCIY